MEVAPDLIVFRPYAERIRMVAAGTERWTRTDDQPSSPFWKDQIRFAAVG